jgi:hypothetical protein
MAIGWGANAADGWPVAARDALGPTAFFLACAVVVVAVIATAVLAGRDTDRSGVSLVIDRRGVYFGGRPPRRLDWSEIRRVEAFVGDRHDKATSDFWSGIGRTYECCFEFWPYEGPESATAPGRHRLERTLRRDYESWQEITRVRAALLRHAPTKIAHDVRPKAPKRRQ